ncbi:MAG: class I SAM-dependent methyltransferase [Deltaproteobacteria bacterium]|nr:MAG: class I SAM-dependent methyltransferase [Deltaproteobacteria bacterium]
MAVTSTVGGAIAVASERALAGLCAELAAGTAADWSAGERALARDAARPPAATVAAARRAIAAGGDPLGDAFCALRSPRARRRDGAVYTPAPLVAAMVGWARDQVEPARVVDPGAGSGRFAVAAARAFPRAQVIAIEADPLAALAARAHLAAAGVAARATVWCADYREVALEPVSGPTLFIGNPPYVRHHAIATRWKRWAADVAARLDVPASGLAGLHVHFFLATALLARPGDLGALVTAAEWLDVDYGRTVRALLRGPLGVVRIDVVEPTAAPFPDAHTTAAIACFRAGAAPPAVAVRRVASMAALAPLRGGPLVPRARLTADARWSRPRRRRVRPAGHVELGELCRVHRGQVTGANAVWIAGRDTPPVPEPWLRPAVTRARELFDAVPALVSAAALRRVVCVPVDVDALAPADRAAADRFLAFARARGAHERYIARHRRPWWAVRLRPAAPILATYMARRPPAFVRNLAGAAHLNIAHGIYPRETLSAEQLDALARHLAAAASVADGRTYAGGLTKFEPGELARILVPEPAALAAREAD